MSVKTGHETLPNVNITGKAKDAYGLPVASTSPRIDKSGSRGAGAGGRGRGVLDGVRVPVLKDMERYGVRGNPGGTCKFDIVEKVTTVIKAGSYGPSDYNNSSGDAGKMVDSNIGGGHRYAVGVARQPTYTSATGLHQAHTGHEGEGDMWAKISPYRWNQWVKACGERDARDVLYKNTYCLQPDHLRYRSLTLPRISDEVRPRTVGDKPVASEYRPTTPDHCRDSSGVTIVPQQPRGSVVRFREYMRPYTYAFESSSLEIKRVNNRSGHNHFTTVKNGFPIIRQDSRQSRRSERPLKFENNARYNRSGKETLFNKQVPPNYKGAFERDYSSADTFKEYLESLQQCASTKTPYLYSRENTKLQNSRDYHNQVLQRVQTVNEPDVNSVPQTPRTKINDNRSITIEIKSSWKEQDEAEEQSALTPPRQHAPRPGTIDNMSSVQGSVKQSRNEPGPGPTSSTVVNAGAGKHAPDTSPAAPPSLRDSEGGATAPANTPTPEDA